MGAILFVSPVAPKCLAPALSVQNSRGPWSNLTPLPKKLQALLLFLSCQKYPAKIIVTIILKSVIIIKNA